ncbi:MAG: hypothetical protein H0X30_36550 [Anaerolineae bacterium]|nr:hypothetical protein [Anaerolineae bacterium]
MTHPIHRLASAIIGLLIILPSLNLAQTVTPVLWPPDPNLIFSDRVKVINLDSPALISPTPTNDTAQNNKCGKPVEHYVSQGAWHFYIDPQSGQTRFCENTTGKITNPLPSNISYWEDFAPSNSPDEQWLAFWDVTLSADSTIDNYVLYSYQIETGKINLLGEIKRDSFRDDVQVAKWVDNRHGTVDQGGGPETFGSSLFSFDVEKENSLQFAFSGWPTFHDNPPRYEFLETKQYLQWKTGSEIGDDVPCVFHIYDKNGVNHYRLGDECLPLYNAGLEEDNEYTMQSGDVYFYKPIKNKSNPISEIDAFNISLGKGGVVLSGNADLVNISPDGEHLILILNHSYLAIYEMASGSIIYMSENVENEFSPHVPYTFNWLHNNQVLIYITGESAIIPTGNAKDPMNYGFPSSYRLVQFNGNQQVSVQAIYSNNLPEPQNASPDGHWVLADGSVYNFATAQHFPIFKTDINLYNVKLSWDSDSHLTAAVRPKDHPTKETFIYTLALVKQ